MKPHHFLLASAWLALTACGSTAQPDLRIPAVRQQHARLLAQQKAYEAQLAALTGNEALTPAHLNHSKAAFAGYVAQSQEILQTLDQLDAGKSRDAAQVALVGQLATKERDLVASATRRLAHVHGEHYLPEAMVGQ